MGRRGNRCCLGTGDPGCPHSVRSVPEASCQSTGLFFRINGIILEDVDSSSQPARRREKNEKTEKITAGSALVSFLKSHNKLHQDNFSYTEHVFEISHCHDLLLTIVNYRICVLKISEEDELDTKLSGISSAKKNKDIIWQPSDEEIIKLAPPTKKA